MRIFKDGLQRNVELSVFPPKKIVSLVPSQTELLYDLGLDTEVLGITKFCIHPHKWRKEKVIVGGTKQVHIHKIKGLQPDLIIANQEENTREIVEECNKICPVYVTNIKTLDDAFEMILNIGDLTDKRPFAEELHTHITQQFITVKNNFSGTFLYFIWQNPYMVAGRDTFIHAVLSHFGFQNTILSTNSRYPELTENDIQSLNPEYVFLSSEPYPFKEKHVQVFKDLLPKSKIYLVDGELFSWYGSRMQYMCKYIDELFQTVK
jgi:ABC-type Fe3+-hydroxamate transport system substrate-binding protein